MTFPLRDVSVNLQTTDGVFQFTTFLLYIFTATSKPVDHSLKRLISLFFFTMGGGSAYCAVLKQDVLFSVFRGNPGFNNLEITSKEQKLFNQSNREEGKG